MRTICVESPFAAATTELEEEHVEYALNCMESMLHAGYAPFLSHLLYTQVLNDYDAGERELGLEAGMAMGDRCSERWFFVDYGFSPGMQAAYTRAKCIGQAVRLLNLDELLAEIL